MNLVWRDFDPRLDLGSAIAREMEVDVAVQNTLSPVQMTSYAKASDLSKARMACPAEMVAMIRHPALSKVHGLSQTRSHLALVSSWAKQLFCFVIMASPDHGHECDKRQRSSQRCLRGRFECSPRDAGVWLALAGCIGLMHVG